MDVGGTITRNSETTPRMEEVENVWKREAYTRRGTHSRGRATQEAKAEEQLPSGLSLLFQFKVTCMDVLFNTRLTGALM